VNGVIENVGDGKTHERLILRTTKKPRTDCRLRLFEFEGFVQNTLLLSGIEVGSADVVGSVLKGRVALTKIRIYQCHRQQHKHSRGVVRCPLFFRFIFGRNEVCIFGERLSSVGSHNGL
jgi:hypothetical protein